MKKPIWKTLLLSLGLAFFSVSLEAQHLEKFFKASDIFLSKYTKNGMVNYRAIKKDPKQIDILTNYIGIAKLGGATDEQKKAFYINAYNLLVISTVVKYFPLNSPLDQNGFFDKLRHEVAGENITLDQLEKGKLMGTYNDPRIHFALACASKSCPPLANFSYKPATLEKQLEYQTTKTLNSDDFIHLKPSANTVEISKIFDWYKGHFKAAGGALAFINKYRKNPIPKTYSVKYYEYNWSINDL